MKKLLIVCGLLFSVITFAKAQDGGRQMPSPEERAKRSVDRLTEKLGLTDDQKSKITAIFLDQAAAITKARQESKGDRDAMRAQVQKINDESDAKITALLNDDQKKKFEAWKAERKERMKNRGDNQSGGSANG